MRLILLHGHPGVGKLTVAKELVKKTGYKLFHNHLTIDLVSSLFDRSYKQFWELNRELRLMLLEEAAKENIDGVIVTYCYIDPIGKLFVEPLLALVKKYDISLNIVYLTCSEEELYKRVEDPSRKGTTKIHTKKALLEALKLLNFTQIPDVESLVIDTTEVSPENTASNIIEHYKLPLTSK